MGDAVLDLIIADALYLRFQDKPEGELSRFRAELVRGSTLADIAREHLLVDVIRLGEGERKSGGAQRESILAGALEAIIGAFYIDAGFEQCKNIILPLFIKRIDGIQDSASRKDSKTALQELMQAQGHSLPRYDVLKTLGKEHKQTFIITCTVDVWNKTIQAEGHSKKIAQQNAASMMLDWIKQEKNL